MKPREAHLFSSKQRRRRYARGRGNHKALSPPTLEEHRSLSRVKPTLDFYDITSLDTYWVFSLFCKKSSDIIVILFS